MALLVAMIVVLIAGICLIALKGRRAAPNSGTHEFLAESFPGAVLTFDRRLRHTSALGCGLVSMGIDPVGMTLHDVFTADVCTVFEPAYRAVFDGEASQLELPLGGRDWFVTVTPMGSEAGLLVATDVTDRKRRERRLTELASKDALTGAWNRTRLAEELEWLTRGGRTGSLLVLDLDGFKGVNDVLGHAAGDELLRRVATAVQGCVRRADVVARLGGDEFAVLLTGATPEEARLVAGKIESAVGAVWPLGVRGGVSVGVSAAGVGAGDALGRADRAMYAAKRRAPERLAS